MTRRSESVSRGVDPFLEALGGDVATSLGWSLPPRRSGALGVFRHPLVRRLLARPVDRFRELNLTFRDPSENRQSVTPSEDDAGASSSRGVSVRSVLKVRRVGVRLAPRRGPTLSVPFPSQRFSRSQGLIPPRPRCHLQAAGALRIPTLQSFVPRVDRYWLVTSPALLDVSSNSPPCRRHAFQRGPCRACRVRRVPEGFSLSRSLTPNLVHLQDERGAVLSWLFRAFVVFPSSVWGLTTHPSLALFQCAQASSRSDRTFDVFPPLPWRCSP